ncbi:hypothetical protein RHGRI_024337 [Rhododendron griersonianum]|uniref:BURP domain-containing protein n=1 Tax=Rhododendron griersonianum TaxID=479676 RepID=A0AAV6JCC5_9ERIC|nr:hypothetical protein RHGRI_024337 [Rhododendron griersonianum]
MSSTFTAYGEMGNGANDSFTAYTSNANNPDNNFKSYGVNGNSAVDSFSSYRQGANAGGDSFQSYGRNSNSDRVNFVNYGKTHSGRTDTFKEYGKGSVETAVGFKAYGVNNTFKDYAKKGVTFAQYANLSSNSNKGATEGNGVSVNKWVEPGKFFREYFLKEGTVMKIPNIRDKMPKRSFLPRVISSKLPFSTGELLESKRIFHAQNESSAERVLAHALSECKRSPSIGETKWCVGSIEESQGYRWRRSYQIGVVSSELVPLLAVLLPLCSKGRHGAQATGHLWHCGQALGSLRSATGFLRMT